MILTLRSNRLTAGRQDQKSHKNRQGGGDIYSCYSDEEEIEVSQYDGINPIHKANVSTPSNADDVDNESNTKNGKKSVTFNPDVVVRRIQGLHDFSDEEKNGSWYSNNDLRGIRGETRTTLSLMNSKTEIPPNFEERFCSRGLEGRTRRAMKMRTQCREAVWAAVMEEQRSQKRESVHDPNAIAEISTIASRHSRKIARETALRDEMEARKGGELSQRLVSMTIQASMLQTIELCRWPIW